MQIRSDQRTYIRDAEPVSQLRAIILIANSLPPAMADNVDDDDGSVHLTFVRPISVFFFKSNKFTTTATALATQCKSPQTVAAGTDSDSRIALAHVRMQITSGELLPMPSTTNEKRCSLSEGRCGW